MKIARYHTSAFIISFHGEDCHLTVEDPDLDDYATLYFPDNYNDNLEVQEGEQQWRTHLSRERDQSLIKEAKMHAKQLHGKLLCEVCGFNFEERYGSRGRDYIEGHHTVPLNQLGSDGGTTRVEDIALVCSNCHKMIHRRRKWLTIEQMKQIFRPIK